MNLQPGRVISYISSCCNDGECCGKLCCEAAVGAHLRQLHSNSTHVVVAVKGQPNHQGNGVEEDDPGARHLTLARLAIFVHMVDSGQRPCNIPNFSRSVGEDDTNGRENLLV